VFPGGSGGDLRPGFSVSRVPDVAGGFGEGIEPAAHDPHAVFEDDLGTGIAGLPGGLFGDAHPIDGGLDGGLGGV